MREILFRGKRLNNGEWYYGSYLFIHISPVDWTGTKMGKPEDVHYIVNDQDINYSVDPSTVGQYTGLKDKNGKKIFEGDIVKTDKFSEPNKQYIIKYDLQFGAFIGQDRYNVYFVTFDGDSVDFEVIGNVHDNQELLEK